MPHLSFQMLMTSILYFLFSIDLNFTALDFETADRLIPCEIGVCVVRDGVIAETRSWLIKPSCYPYMNDWNEKIHGISTRDLTNAPYFDTVWSEIEPYLKGRLLVLPYLVKQVR